MAERRNTLDQFDTPRDVADLLLGFCLRRPADRVLDPGCGNGLLLRRATDWIDWLAPSPTDVSPQAIWGVELDPESAKEAQLQLPHAHILNQNFFALDPEAIGQMDVLVGNPPYTRAQWIGQMETSNVRQIPMFVWSEEAPVSDKLPLISRSLARSLSSRSGLHAYFFLQGEQFLCEGGRLGFVVPNGWLDIAYGTELKQFLLDHFRILAIVESTVERWFTSANVNTCLVILVKCGVLGRRSINQVRLIRLKQPLRQLLPVRVGLPRRLLAVEQLASQLMPVRPRATKEFAVHVVQQNELRAADKWGMALRAPTVYRHHRDHLNLFPIKQWATVQRGYTTGANEFFYLNKSTVAKWSIETRYRRPLLKSLRGIEQLRLDANNCQQEVLIVPPDDDLHGTAVADYITWGEAQGYDQRHTCAVRHPWYSLPPQTPAPLVMPKGIWQRHLAPILSAALAVDQQLYLVLPARHVSLLATAALFNSSWFALQIELQGRVNFGKGLLWLAAYELGEVRLPDPRRLTPDQVTGLEQAFRHLEDHVLAGSAPESTLLLRRAVDGVVFDVLGFTTAERNAVIASLKERIMSRQTRASYVKE